MTRLIDADDMIKSLMDMTFYDAEGNTIHDYEDRLAIVKSFVDPVSTVDAVPIEWIEKYVESKTALLGDSELWIKWMIDDWQKEQEKQND